MLTYHRFLLTAAVGSLLFVAGAAAQERAYHRIGPHDKIEIRVVELPDLDREFEVDDDGMVELPNVGTIEARGRTERELADALRQRLETVGLRRATVTVRVVEFARPVAVLGAVASPGNLPVGGPARLLDILLRAGGVTSERGRTIHVRRSAGNGLTDQVSIRVDELFDLGDPAVNIPIFAGDVIHVPPAQTVRIHFLGEVATPGIVTFKNTERVTLLLAIARAGGLNDAASSKIRILRGEGAGNEIVANYRKILSGRDRDVDLLDGDIVVVKESFF